MHSPPFRVKICGVRTMRDVQAVAAAGGDAVGINCFAKSKRYVGLEIGRQISEFAKTEGIEPFALFVNASLDEIRTIKEAWGLEHVQLHGDESHDFVMEIQQLGLHVLRAIRLPPGPLTVYDIESRISPWEQAGCTILLDADVGNRYGGEGASLDWRSIEVWRLHRESEEKPARYVLAGGLGVDRIARAIQTCRPSAVDVASGVEREKGVKDAVMIEQFCAAAHRELSAFAQT